jgi:DNA ligase-1
MRARQSAWRCSTLLPGTARAHQPFVAFAGRRTGHVGGRGRHANRLGALLVETRDGKRFRIGGGFTDAQRENPPAIGAWVTYRYNGLTSAGLPRFARFLRVRGDPNL